MPLIPCISALMSVHPSGYYAWRSDPTSPRAKEDQRLLGLIKHAWLESGGVYGYRKITHDLRDLGERCGKHRVYRLMRRRAARPGRLSPSCLPLRAPCSSRQQSAGTEL